MGRNADAVLDLVGPDIKVWDGGDLTGTWNVTIKIDGVRALWTGTEWRSRADKPLYNLPPPLRIRGHRTKLDGSYISLMPGDNCELYMGSLKDSIRAVRTQHLKPDTPRPTANNLFSLDPLDPRLDRGPVTGPTAAWIRKELRVVNSMGYEGLVLRQGSTWLKVKPAQSFDLLVLGVEEGKGKHKGRMGFLITKMGKVGTGFTDKERADWWARREAVNPATFHGLPLERLKITIEIEAMQLTPDGKLRHPRFIRERFDKNATE